ncbi:putative (S)-ureidoglycine aminohydrolase [Gracilariopsis chorda]|uniref:Putative (S)-ureidoglycine aminohydrolase n=1 Tax=Gracilariopsis chorda TaxID=448386 RepID=A0A2V3IZP2_9FLOR|nr:putative (S)-ureidoglycine aminohydrolase [Gracilariopsis chorda]|eukprot:PXF47636.1 putative (S)-ureidoglycine aminohydrolase [Gracilariopsis chorda]
MPPHNSRPAVFAILFMQATLALAQPPSCTSAQCQSEIYSDAATPLSQPLAGHTRSVFVPNSHALIDPNSRVFGAPFPGWKGSVSAAAVVTPALGAHFTMYIANATGPSTLPQPVSFEASAPSLERLIFVLTGSLTVNNASDTTTLTSGSFVYIAPLEDNLSISVSDAAVFIQIDKNHALDDYAPSVIGSEKHTPVEITAGEHFQLRRLLDPTNPSYDFNIHIMDFEPGQYLNVNELHYNQHGLLMLRGFGIYRLANAYFHVSTGDVIYMAPFVPQWYAALGTQPTRYFLYKDTNVDPLIHY